MRPKSLLNRRMLECMFAKKIVDHYNEVIKKNVDEDTFFTDFNSFMTDFTRQQFDKYEHRKNYELFWCQDLYTRLYVL